MATGNITRLEGVWPETHERAVRDSAGITLETKLGNINSNISQLDQKVTGIDSYSFSASTGEHSANSDKHPIDYKAGTTLKGTISLGTAQWNSQSLSVALKDANGTNVLYRAITMGTEFELVANSDAETISFYIYKITTAGTFEVTLDYGGLQKEINETHGEVALISDAVSSLEEEVNGTIQYSFEALSQEHSSSLDKHPINYKAGTPLIGKIEQGTGVCNGSSVRVYLYNDTTIVRNVQITLGQQFVISGTSDANYISFYLYKVTTYGTFLVSLTYRGVVEDINNVQKVIDTRIGELPPYYYDTMLPTKVASIRSAMLNAEKNGSTFVWITDVHWPDNTKQSPKLIGYLLSQLPINDVIYGGDTFNGGEESTQVGYLADFGKKMHLAAPRFFSVFGNHDLNVNDGGTGLSADHFYTLLLKYADYLVVPGDYDNYYFDNLVTKTRHIILNTGSGDYRTTEQAAWLDSVLSEMSAGFHAIIFLHIAFLTISNLNNNIPAPLMAAAATIADAFNGQDDGRKVEAFIAGHLHIDANKTTPGGIPIVLTDCDSYSQTQTSSEHGAGSENEQAFDVITVDYSGKITCVRIGRGNDREISF